MTGASRWRQSAGCRGLNHGRDRGGMLPGDQCPRHPDSVEFKAFQESATQLQLLLRLLKVSWLKY